MISQSARIASSVRPRHGVVTLFGYKIRAQVDHGHLILEDGIGATRRQARFPPDGHGLKRLVVIGSDGMVSLSALRWLADQDAAFVMLDRDGSVLATTGPVRSSDALLRRAQVLAEYSGAALEIARELINQKLAGQEQLVRNRLSNLTAARTISDAIVALSNAKTIQDIRLFESQAEAAYWSAWHALPIAYPRKDLDQIPNHWRIFGARKSPRSGSPRLTINPPNAMLNYLYGVLESEASLALSAHGLDLGVGVLRVDMPAQDSLACDLMEPIRPKVDAFVLDWIARKPLHREWFLERGNGNCRLMGFFAGRLSETTETWRHSLAPFAEWICRMLLSTMQKRSRQVRPATRLAKAKGGVLSPHDKPATRPTAVCRTCGAPINFGDKYCRACAVTVCKETLLEAAKAGRVATHSAKAEAFRSATQRRQAAALKAWNPADKPDWLDEKTYREKIQPRLAGVAVPAISSVLAVSQPYAANIRAGRCIPHPRHWLAIARLAGVLRGRG
jgi:CRISPR-associated endonuclease Cas1